MKTLPHTCEHCLEQFGTALEELKIFSNRGNGGSLTDSQARDLIINFEVTHELALKVMQKYFERMGKGPFSGSRDTTLEAFHADLIDDGKSWLDMIIDRIQYNPVYTLDTQQKFLENIRHRYISILDKFEYTMKKKLDE
jgi:nucleotidyltransferase substrate binding protein (TIGR01987 family)